MGYCALIFGVYIENAQFQECRMKLKGHRWQLNFAVVDENESPRWYVA